MRQATPAAGSPGRWPSQRSMRNAVLPRRALPDLEMLENDPGLAKILHRVETFGMKRSERRLLERRESPRSARCLLPRRYSTWQRFTRQLKRRCGEPGSTSSSLGSALSGLAKVNSSARKPRPPADAATQRRPSAGSASNRGPPDLGGNRTPDLPMEVTKNSQSQRLPPIGVN